MNMKPPNGKWPTGTFLQLRLAQLKAQEAEATLQAHATAQLGQKATQDDAIPPVE